MPCTEHAETPLPLHSPIVTNVQSMKEVGGYNEAKVHNEIPLALRFQHFLK